MNHANKPPIGLLGFCIPAMEAMDQIKRAICIRGATRV